MKPIPIFIDTSSLPRNPSYLGLGFERLCQLAQSDLAQVYISEVVRQEWFTQLHDEWNEILRNARKSMRRVVTHPWSSKLKEFNSLENSCEVLIMESLLVQVIAERNFKELMGKLRAEILSIRGSHANKVIESYFRGYSPFSSKKIEMIFRMRLFLKVPLIYPENLIQNYIVLGPIMF